MQVIDVFEQIGDEEKRVDFVLMLGRLGKLVVFVGARFKIGRVVLAEMPRSASRLNKRLFGRQSVVDARVRSGQSSVNAGNDICWSKERSVTRSWPQGVLPQTLMIDWSLSPCVMRGYFG